MNKLRWGILGAAGIARRNWRALYHSGNGTLAAVAARDRTRAEQFVREGQAQWAFDPAPVVLGDYEEVILSREVEAVYLPLPTRRRQEWVIRAARAGKHVLCEKPCAVSAPDLREMLSACQQHGVQFMDGVMFMHSPRLEAVRRVLDDATRIGPLRRIMSVFSFGSQEDKFQSNIRIQADLEPAGCLGDLGWYCLRIALFAARWELPSLATGRILAMARDGRTPTQFSGELMFRDGLSAGFYCGFVAEGQQWVTISGAQGAVRMSDFVHPGNTYEPGFEINRTEHRVMAEPGTMVPGAAGALSESGHPTAQDTRMFRNFTAQVRSGQINTHWPEIALKTQLVMDACLASGRGDGQPVAVQPL